MLAYLKINGVDFTPYIRERGLTWEETVRKSRRVTVLNGTDYRAEIQKLRGAVQLVTVPDTVWEKLQKALASAKPATVEYATAGGAAASKPFYVMGVREPLRNVIGGRTYYSGVSFALEEK